MADRPDLEARARAGEWLRPGDAAQLLDIGRTTMHRRLEDGTIGWRLHAGGNQRRVNPEDLLRALEKSRADRRGEMPDPGHEKAPEA
jgi:excisionase family DNA binding protein